MPLLMKKSLIAAAVESTPGTAETLAAGDGAYNAYDISYQADIESEQRQGQGGFGKLSAVPGQTAVTISFKTDMGWDGSGTYQDWANVLLPGAGIVDSSGTFTPRTEAPGSNVKTLTLGGYCDGKRFLAAGCAGNGKIVAPAGRMSYIEWTFRGVFQSDADAAILSPTYPTDELLKYSGATTTFNSVSADMSQVEIDFGNDVQPIESGNSTNGLKYFMITDRTPIITGDPESVLVATQDRYGAWTGRTQAEFSLLFDGPSTSTLEIEAPKAQITNLAPGERVGIKTDQITWECGKNGATHDEELKLIFTASA